MSSEIIKMTSNTSNSPSSGSTTPNFNSGRIHGGMFSITESTLVSTTSAGKGVLAGQEVKEDDAPPPSPRAQTHFYLLIVVGAIVAVGLCCVTG
jgi:hypothetical protein